MSTFFDKLLWYLLTVNVLIFLQSRGATSASSDKTRYGSYKIISGGEERLCSTAGIVNSHSITLKDDRLDRIDHLITQISLVFSP